MRFATILLLVSANLSAASDIHNACEFGTEDEVKKLLDENPKLVRERDENLGFTPLHTAVAKGRVKIIQSLLEHGADIDAKDNLERSPIFYVATTEGIDAFKLLIEKKASLNVHDKMGWSLATMTAIHGRKDILDSMIEHGYVLDIFDALLNHRQDAVEKLLKENPALAKARGIAGRTPLHFVTDRQQFETLMAYSPDLYAAENEFGFTPIHQAVFDGRTEIVKLLLASGVDANLKTKDGDSVLHMAAINGKLETLTLLLDHKAMVNARGIGALTPLHRAIRTGKKDAIVLLIESGADVNLIDEKGDSALSMALKNKRPEIVEILKKHGAK